MGNRRAASGFWHMRFNLRTLLVLTTLFSLFLSYVGSYWQLSRRGMTQADRFGMHGWMYVPMAEVETELAEDQFGFLVRHQRRRLLYFPLAWMDVEVLGNPPPIRGGIWGLK